jgi:hypothetical protein
MRNEKWKTLAVNIIQLCPVTKKLLIKFTTFMQVINRRRQTQQMSGIGDTFIAIGEMSNDKHEWRT